jgi:hypothetical protein
MHPGPFGIKDLPSRPGLATAGDRVDGDGREQDDRGPDGLRRGAEQLGRMSWLVISVSAVADLIFSPPGN